MLRKALDDPSYAATLVKGTPEAKREAAAYALMKMGKRWLKMTSYAGTGQFNIISTATSALEGFHAHLALLMP